jgi:hypothetical protein
MPRNLTPGFHARLKRTCKKEGIPDVHAEFWLNPFSLERKRESGDRVSQSERKIGRQHLICLIHDEKTTHRSAQEMES